MIDREKVANGLKHCLHYNGSCLDCPYDGPNCQNDVLDDALTLLKKQEPMPMLEVEDDDLYAWSPEDVNYYCPRPECGKEISYDYNFCPYCGQAVKLK